MHRPVSLGLPESRLHQFDLIIQLSSNWFNFVFHSSAAMPASPVEALDQARPYVQKGLLGPDGNWLSKRDRQNEAGSNAVASPVDPQIFDGLTGTRVQAIVPRMRKAGELLRGMASIT